MKRPHRRAHLAMWVVLTPVTVILAVYFWTMRPDTPISDIPAAIETTSTEER